MLHASQDAVRGLIRPAPRSNSADIQGGVAPRALVGLHKRLAFAGLHPHGYDLLAKALLVYRGDGLLVAAEGEAVLGLPGDVVSCGHLVGLVLIRCE
jgi:hypothetical protein